MILVITGNPGVGKHTVAKHLAKTLNLKIIDINKLAIESKVFEKSDEAIDVDVIKLKKIIKEKISKNSLIVGHLAPFVLTKSQIDTAIILRKSPYKLISIYKKRNYSKKKISDNLQSEILGIVTYDAITKFGRKKTHQVNTTSKSIQKITKNIQDILDGKILEEQIDWLSEVSNNNDLKKFFPN